MIKVFSARADDERTFLKAGSTMKPLERYNENFPNDYEPLTAKNVIAVSNGHCQNIELAIISVLRANHVCDNVPYDNGQVTRETEQKMFGKKVFYYLAKKN